MLKYFEEADIAVTVVDNHGTIIEMNRQSREVNEKDGVSLTGSNVLDCHHGASKAMLESMMQNETKHVYTIEKNGKKKLIYQIPWYEDGVYMGFMELSMVIPFEMEHKVRTP
ncbi:diguanylate cyclase [Porphyromonas pogonae]|uniref:diguanylate cyclase n=1 Tax=Porphyromonas pogonae TaxID=867595 RepID=UPI002E79DC89|nr:diguanylate cyclase [Porphyromonas pogonae]